jgi:hypothetical protein
LLQSPHELIRFSRLTDGIRLSRISAFVTGVLLVKVLGRLEPPDQLRPLFGGEAVVHASGETTYYRGRPEDDIDERYVSVANTVGGLHFRIISIRFQALA